MNVEYCLEPRPQMVPLTHKGFAFLHLVDGSHAKIDLEDYERCRHYRWRICGRLGKRHAVAYTTERRVTGKAKRLRPCVLSQFIHNGFATLQEYVPFRAPLTFRNGDALDCRKSNLVLEDQRNLVWNVERYAARGLPRGVIKDSSSSRQRPYKAMARLGGGTRRCLGYFASAEEAATAYRRATQEYDSRLRKDLARRIQPPKARAP